MTTCKKNIDIAKFIMAIIVVSIHTDPFIQFSNFYYFYHSIIGLPVPFFFLATGFFIGIKMKDTGGDYTKSLVKYIKLYLIWTIIYLPLAIHYYVFSSDPSFTLYSAIKNYIIGLFFTGEHYNSWMLWYLLSVIYTLLLLFIFSKIKLPEKVSFIISGLIGLPISIIFNFFSTNYENSEGLLHFISWLTRATIFDGRILRGFLYIPLGIMISRISINKIISSVCFISGYIVILLDNFWLNDVAIAICSVGLFCLIISIPNEKIKIETKSFRKMSIVIYFLHMYVYTAYYMVIYGKKTVGIDSFIVTTVLCIIIGYIYSSKSKLIPEIKTKIVNK